MRLTTQEDIPINLKKELSAFDGKHTEPLEEIASSLDTNAATIRRLCTLSRDVDIRMQTAATWILKRLHDEGLTYSKSQSERFIDLLSEVSNWEAVLHILQILPGLQISDRQASALYKVLRQQLDSENKLVRAWSYNGLAVLGEQHPKFRRKAAESLQAAEQDPAASVRARVRNVMKKATWAREFL